jgi:catechol 2,3-dioxygenase-like lactoylglutathione lyase family enzyme
MPMRYAHTNIVARDWERLAAFYERVFGCVPVGPTRDLAGTWLDQATGIPGVRIRGRHLRLPGHGAGGPTLEIFSYEPATPGGPASLPNRPGLGHLAFAVDDVDAACAAVVGAGGSLVGRAASGEVEGAGALRFAYVRDPEGNVIELQRWG